MKKVRVRDLSLSLTDDGRVMVRVPTRGIGARVPAMAIGVLAFCSVPRSPEEVARAFGPAGPRLFAGLADAGLLVDEAEATQTPSFFDNFSQVDVHRRMLADRPRLDAYKAALDELAAGSTVLDAGTGSGVLAAFAHQAGAERVFAVDRGEVIDQARETFSRSKLPIQALDGDFAEITVEGGVDLVVTETFGAMALCEGSAPDLQRCLDNNLRDGGQVIPRAIELWVAPVLDRALFDKAIGPFSVPGVDLSAFAEAARKRALSLEIGPDQVGQPACFAVLPYPDGGDRVGGTVTLEADGWIYGLAGWFVLRLTEAVRLSTAPDAPLTHWGQSYFPWEPMEVHGPLEIELQLSPSPDDRRSYELTGRWSAAGREGFSFHRLR